MQLKQHKVPKRTPLYLTDCLVIPPLSEELIPCHLTYHHWLPLSDTLITPFLFTFRARLVAFRLPTHHFAVCLQPNGTSEVINMWREGWTSAGEFGLTQGHLRATLDSCVCSTATHPATSLFFAAGRWYKYPAWWDWKWVKLLPVSPSSCCHETITHTNRWPLNHCSV